MLTHKSNRTKQIYVPQWTNIYEWIFIKLEIKLFQWKKPKSRKKIQSKRVWLSLNFQGHNTQYTNLIDKSLLNCNIIQVTENHSDIWENK